MEIEPLGVPLADFVYSLEVKRNFRKEVAYHVPPRRPASLVRAIEELAVASARALGCRDLCRVDVRLGADGAPRFLEANPLPGLAPETSDVVILANLAGISYVDLIDRIVKTALARLGRSPCHAV
jgi:D-alanine-D-alanine ligase